MISRSALIWLSRQEGLKEFATRFGFFKKLTTRFVAGDTIDDAAGASASLTTVIVVFAIAAVLILPSLGLLYVLSQRRALE